MSTFNLEEYRQVLDKRIKKLKKISKKTPKVVAKFLVLNAKKLAPRKTGATINGITSRKFKDGQLVQSYVSGRFKQNMFADRRPPFRTVDYPEGAWIGGKMIAPPGTVAIYGRSPRNWRWTGTPKFFQIATRKTKIRFWKLSVRDVTNTLKLGK